MSLANSSAASLHARRLNQWSFWFHLIVILCNFAPILPMVQWTLGAVGRSSLSDVLIILSICLTMYLVQAAIVCAPNLAVNALTVLYPFLAAVAYTLCNERAIAFRGGTTGTLTLSDYLHELDNFFPHTNWISAIVYLVPWIPNLLWITAKSVLVLVQKRPEDRRAILFWWRTVPLPDGAGADESWAEQSGGAWDEKKVK